MAVPGTSKVGTGTAKTSHSFLTSLDHASYVIWCVVAGADLQLSGSVFQYRNRPFHPRSISPYARLERFACLSFLNRLTVSPVIHHNEESTAGVRIERTF
uniref:hypothetical protein n=2 Tax=Citrobacter freundii TaxID=546 RepID=UPI000AE3F854